MSDYIEELEDHVARLEFQNQILRDINMICTDALADLVKAVNGNQDVLNELKNYVRHNPLLPREALFSRTQLNTQLLKQLEQKIDYIRACRTKIND